MVGTLSASRSCKIQNARCKHRHGNGVADTAARGRVRAPAVALRLGHVGERGCAASGGDVRATRTLESRHDRSAWRALWCRWPPTSSRSSGWSPRATEAVYVGASPTSPPAVVRTNLATGVTTVLRSSATMAFDRASVSVPEAIEFPTGDGLTAHAFYYPPRNGSFDPPAAERPPLLVISHGGPTTQTKAQLDLQVQFWTTRGCAVVDVNYGGSSGYRPCVPRTAQRAVGHRRRGRLPQRRPVPRRARLGGREAAHHPRRQRGRLHDAGGADVPSGRLRGGRQLLRRQRRRGAGHGHPQVRIALPRWPHRAVSRERKTSTGPARRFTSRNVCRAR